MQYPLISEYKEAILNAEANFDKLVNLHPVLDAKGEPIMSSGNFAVVFKMTDGTKNYAIKCFLREQERRAEAYKQICEYLSVVHSEYLVHTEYLEKELFVDTAQSDDDEFPVLKMDWVDGVMLEHYMEKIKDNEDKRISLFKEFQKLSIWILTQEFAHTDIKPDNILVTNDNKLVLIDYDGMFVPSMEGQKSRELGTPSFRFKGRTLDDFNEMCDDYACIFIMLILKINSLKSVSFYQFTSLSTVEIMNEISEYVERPDVAPLVSAFMMVASAGILNRQLLHLLLADNSNYSISLEQRLTKKAKKGNVLAMIKLSKLYRVGKYVPESTALSIQWAYFASIIGSDDAEASLFRSLCKSIPFAVELYRQRAEKGDVDAQCDLGVCYHNGYGVEQNYTTAVKWYTKAAEQGDANAQYSLGDCYEKGDGVEQNYTTAVKWYTKAAEQGDVDAQYSLGNCYGNGYGVEQNYTSAVKWYTKAAEQGNASAQYNLGFCYENGYGVEQDYTSAVKWYTKAAEQGNASAQYNLGFCYEKGSGVWQNHTTAVKWYTKAAEQGDANAQFNLGFCYEKGYGVEQNYPTAVKWYTKAAEQGNASASIRVEEFGKALNKQTRSFTVNGVIFEMIFVEGGTFLMGATPEQVDCFNHDKIVHKVTLSSYIIGKYEVTQALWMAVMRSNPSYFKGDDLPVENVSWDDCQEFLNKLNKITGMTFRLLTEAEWEFAARGGNKSKDFKYSGNYNLDKIAWYDENSNGRTHPIGTKIPNELGIYDMSGNVWEWCQDRWGIYSSLPQTNPAGASDESGRVGRGGSWNDGEYNCQSSARLYAQPYVNNNEIGFRLALSL
jgi:TPR repeat protein/RIO-like serine/threonine protein kinase